MNSSKIVTAGIQDRIWAAGAKPPGSANTMQEYVAEKIKTLLKKERAQQIKQELERSFKMPKRESIVTSLG